MMTDDAQFGFALEGMEAPKPISAHAVRLELNEIIDIARAARDHAPWDAETHRRHRATFVDRAKVLPPEEAEFLRRQFVMELDRIDLLLAA
jgi:cytochrome c556